MTLLLNFGKSIQHCFNGLLWSRIDAVPHPVISHFCGILGPLSSPVIRINRTRQSRVGPSQPGSFGLRTGICWWLPFSVASTGGGSNVPQIRSHHRPCQFSPSIDLENCSDDSIIFYHKISQDSG
jgi:hypothetical protein